METHCLTLKITLIKVRFISFTTGQYFITQLFYYCNRFFFHLQIHQQKCGNIFFLYYAIFIHRNLFVKEKQRKFILY